MDAADTAGDGVGVEANVDVDELVDDAAPDSEPAAVLAPAAVVMGLLPDCVADGALRSKFCGALAGVSSDPCSPSSSSGSTRLPLVRASADFSLPRVEPHHPLP